MKHIIFPLAFAAMAWSATAQDSTPARAYEQQETCVTSEMTKVLATLPDEKMVGSASEQGRDKLDSTYYLDTKVYAANRSWRIRPFARRSANRWNA